MFALRTPVLRTTLERIQIMCSAAPQRYSSRSLHDTVQDHLFAVYLSYVPGLSMLYDVAFGLVLEAGLGGASLREHIERFRSCCAGLAQNEAGTSTPCSLHDFSKDFREGLMAEVLCDTVVDVFSGGPLVTNLTGDYAAPLDVFSASLANVQGGVLNAELLQRGLHPGSSYANNNAHLRKLLHDHVQDNLFTRDRSVWPQLTRLRLAMRADQEPGIGMHTFVQESIAHRRTCASLLLQGRAATARRHYAHRVGVFLSTL